MVRIIGGGLAGCEAAYQLLKRGYSVELYEMRPVKNTPAHKTEGLAELVCSNSLKSEDVTTSQGLLKKEMSLFGSLILECADKARVPAGGALAVDREVFSREVERRLNEFDGFKLVREEVTEIGTEVIVASGPLTSEKLSESIIKLTGADKLYFYDAVAPIVTLESVDKEKSFWSARYNKGTDDYLNCPMSKDEYDAFYDALVNAQTVILKEFEKREIFEGCMPVEVMAKRGVDALRFGPLRPVGIFGENGERYYAVVQLRKEDNYDSLVNLVGFQTNLTFGEQKRVFSMIPALHDAEFVRYGVMHRNTYINSPAALTESFNLKSDKSVFFAGQITGVEGYMESTMSGLIAGINMARYLDGKEPLDLPETSLCGSLSRYVANCKSNFQPMHVSFALLPPLDGKTKKQDRKAKYSERAINDLTAYLNEIKELKMEQVFRGTTICAVKRNGITAIGGDGQVTFGDKVIFKGNAVKVKRIFDDKVVVGFAGSVSDAFALSEKFEEMLQKFSGNLVRAAVELAETWRMDKARKLEAMLITADKDNLLIVSGTGEVIEPESGVCAIGSGGNYALSAARALAENTDMDAKTIVEKAMKIAGDLCVFTNHHVTVETI